MDGMMLDYYAAKTSDYMRDVVHPKSIRQERLLSELAGDRIEVEATAPRQGIFTRVFAATRAALEGVGRRIAPRSVRRPTQPFAPVSR
jgi:hypothetical protein